MCCFTLRGRKIIKKINPIALITGTSSPGLGIDEALLACAGEIHTYTIQDPVGFLVPGFGFTAKTQLIAGLTIKREKLSQNEVNIGPIRFEQFQGIDTEHIGHEWRKNMGSPALSQS